MSDFDNFEEIKDNERFNSNNRYSSSNFNSGNGKNYESNDWSNNRNSQNSFRDKSYNSNRGSYGSNGDRGSFKKKNDRPFNPELVKLYLPFAATGNRNIPDADMERMLNICKTLISKGYTLRTGGLDGPDDILFKQIKDLELYLPWRNFSDKDSKLYFNTKECLEIAKRHHPAFDSLKPAIQAFLGMNTRMILGKDLKSPVIFVLGWSEDGAELLREKTSKTGSFGHVIALAHSRKIPVFNIIRSDVEERLFRFLDIEHNVDNGAFNHG